MAKLNSIKVIWIMYTSIKIKRQWKWRSNKNFKLHKLETEAPCQSELQWIATTTSHNFAQCLLQVKEKETISSGPKSHF